MAKSRKLTGVKINVQKSLEATLSNQMMSSLERSRSLDNPVLKASCVWEKVSDQLLDIIGEQVYKQWFGSVLPIVIVDKILILECKNSFQARWLNSHYQGLVDLLISFQDKKISSFFVSQSEKKRIFIN
ncbi:MAG: DnaA N-terminal domain-containing protein [Bacteriovoracaceae bacterium]